MLDFTRVTPRRRFHENPPLFTVPPPEETRHPTRPLSFSSSRTMAIVSWPQYSTRFS
jgi:hypothetical protein